MLRSLVVLLVATPVLLASYRPPPGGAPFLGLADDRGRLPVAAFQMPARLASDVAQLQDQAERGDVASQVRLGGLYYNGEKVEQDWVQARVWLRKASEQGDREAQAKLGAMCFLGQGGTEDYDQALVWFRRAAEQGEPYAQGCMGVMYAVGAGVPQDLVEAYAWLLQAKDGGDDDAAEPFQQVKTKMTPAQIREGNRRAQESVRRRAGN